MPQTSGHLPTVGRCFEPFFQRNCPTFIYIYTQYRYSITIYILYISISISISIYIYIYQGSLEVYQICQHVPGFPYLSPLFKRWKLFFPKRHCWICVPWFYNCRPGRPWLGLRREQWKTWKSIGWRLAVFSQDEYELNMNKSQQLKMKVNIPRWIHLLKKMLCFSGYNRIHGTGRFTYMKTIDLRPNVGRYSSPMDPPWGS